MAKHRGVSAAARHIPYGIQQSAISAQLIQLEDSLGVTLFHRRPFELTHAGRDLFAHIEPFFKGLPQVEEKLRGGREVRVRIGAPEAIQQFLFVGLLLSQNLEFLDLLCTQRPLKHGHATNPAGEADTAAAVDDTADGEGATAVGFLRLVEVVRIPPRVQA